MFDDFANPPKGKGKEKDVGKRRAYVRVITSLGGGALNLELFCEKVCLPHVFFSVYSSCLSSGSKDMLQLPPVGQGREVQRLSFPSTRSGFHGELAACSLTVQG